MTLISRLKRQQSLALGKIYLRAISFSTIECYVFFFCLNNLKFFNLTLQAIEGEKTTNYWHLKNSKLVPGSHYSYFQEYTSQHCSQGSGVSWIMFFRFIFHSFLAVFCLASHDTAAVLLFFFFNGQILHSPSNWQICESTQIKQAMQGRLPKNKSLLRVNFLGVGLIYRAFVLGNSSARSFGNQFCLIFYTEGSSRWQKSFRMLVSVYIA